MTGPGPLRLLYGAQAVAAVGMAAGGTAGGLLAVEISGDPTTVVLPLGALVLGATVAVPPVSVAMRWRGRRAGLLLGLVTAVIGALLVLAGAEQRQLGLVLAGNALLGAGNTAVMFGRYAAADLVGAGDDPAAARRATRAVAAALSAAAVGAVLGPNLLAPAGRLAGDAGLPVSAGLYVVAVPAFAVAALLVIRLPAARPGPARTAEPAAVRPGGGTATPRWPLVASLLLGVANATMVTMMAVVPQTLHHHGWDLPAVGLVVSLHVAAMFGFSPVSGWLCNRFPVTFVAAGGTVLSAMTAIGIGLVGDQPGRAVAAAALLVVLGLAWNVQMVGGTMLLVTGLPPARRHLGEALGEVAMGVAAAVGTLSAAPLLAYAGLDGLGGCAAVLSLMVAELVFRARRPDGPVRAAPAAVAPGTELSR
jgi:MFS family permease